MFFIIIFLSPFLGITQQHEFPKTQQLLRDLAHLKVESSSLDTCVKSVDNPLNDVIQFHHNLREINSLVATIANRIEASSDIMDVVLLIPYVGQAAAAVLGPATAVLNGIQTGLETVDGIIGHYANSLSTWTAPLEVIHGRIPTISGKLRRLSHAIANADTKTKLAKSCTENVPVSPASISSLEGTAVIIDIIPNGLLGPLASLNTGCHTLKQSVTQWTPRGISLGPVKDVLKVIVNIFGPIGRFLDGVDRVLRKKFCLIESIKVIVHGVEYIGKEIVKGAEHVVDGLGHAWVEVKEEAGRVLGHLGGDIEQELTNIGHVLDGDLKQLLHGAEQIGHQIIEGVESVGHKIVEGAEHLGEDIKHAGEAALKEAEHIGHVVIDGVKTAEHEVVEGAKHVGEEVVKGLSAIGNAIKHLFGRQTSPNAWRLMGGSLYNISDENTFVRYQRDHDICISMNDILKGVSFPIGGLLTKVVSIIGNFFHGKLPFHIPGLSDIVLGLGSKLLASGLDLTVPVDSTSVLALPAHDVGHAAERLESNLFEKELASCTP